jgi:hypothetical protein
MRLVCASPEKSGAADAHEPDCNQAAKAIMHQRERKTLAFMVTRQISHSTDLESQISPLAAPGAQIHSLSGSSTASVVPGLAAGFCLGFQVPNITFL